MVRDFRCFMYYLVMVKSAGFGKTGATGVVFRYHSRVLHKAAPGFFILCRIEKNGSAHHFLWPPCSFFGQLFAYFFKLHNTNI